MKLDEYQAEACDTDKTNRHRIMALLGLAGEVGSIFTIYKKRQRNIKFGIKTIDRERLVEELGDVLWYLSTVAKQEGISLSEVAAANLEKVRMLFGELDPTTMPNLELSAVKEEQFPRQFSITFVIEDPGSQEEVVVYLGDKQVGNRLRSHSYEEDDYRFHDVFHLANIAYLGWSPVFRDLMGRKRVSLADVREIEDGGRAQIVEEAIIALMFQEAEGQGNFRSPEIIPFSLLKTIRRMVHPFQVKQCSTIQWRLAIYEGLRAFERLREEGGGVIHVDMDKPSLTFESTKASS